MSKEKITLDTRVNSTQFRQYIDEMLLAKEKIDYIRMGDGVLPKSHFVKQEYAVTEKQEEFRENFSREISEQAERKLRNWALILQTLLLAAFVVFYFVYWNATGRLIGNGWLLIVPLAFIVFLRYGEDGGVRKEKEVEMGLAILYAIFGAIIPIVSLVKASDASPEKGRFITVSIIVYFVCSIPALVLPWIIELFMKKPIEKKLRRKPKNAKKFRLGIAEAKQQDEEEAEYLRRSDEERYRYYVDLMSRKEEVEEEWARYEELYELCSGRIGIPGMVERAHPEVPAGYFIDHYSNDVLIKKGADLFLKHITGTHRVGDILLKLEDVAFDMMKKKRL